jgi:hypothetical protein
MHWWVENSMLTTNNDSLLAGVTALQNDDNLFKEIINQ